MDSAGARNRGPLEGLYRLIMRRTSVYATFVIAGAFIAERGVDYGIRRIWETKNYGKRFEDISVLGQYPPE